MENLTKKEKKELHKYEALEKLQKEHRNNLIKKIIYWVLGTAALILTVWVLLVSTTSNQATETIAVKAPPITKDEISTGPTGAKVTIIEYADFQCPACAAYSPITRQLKKEFEGKIRYIFRFFPLSSHQYSMIAAQAGYAAYLQGKFWEMDNLLYDNQKTWSSSTEPLKYFKEYATSLGLDMSKFEADMNAESTKNFIKNQSSKGTEAGVNSTPSFFINGVKIQNPQGYNAFKALIQAKLDQ
ncbi:DsbA family protein [Patescibacteria group bacterium]|nr:DsbA family protein [Patescibacteria group bacterium]